ncbi:serine hydrolase domain-containing protein [Leifsonia sp. PS1209]|uniref:serine hydrolase domain-containing protein n=1 Tax=Leifsonia sp. PS1209 TaxID=2724914 RepID=UPI001442D98C|nr:serine hydrolase domain-containing protein [Leifsonia sp. PS1209]QJA00453.1 beta-lactamase family protein [Leifsonia sp. PS1209]
MRRRARRITAVALASVLALVLAACTPNAGASSTLPKQVAGGFSSEVTGKLKTAVTDAMKQAGASGAMVGVWAPWAGSWTDGIGTTTLKGSKPVTAGMTFRIAQNTMPMTCTVLLGLVDDGTVELDDPLTKWLPGLVGVDGVTLRELCQNTSGIGDFQGQLNHIFLNNPTRQWPALELASDGLATQPFGKPGEKLGVSMTNFVLLGMALENAAGKSWQDLYSHYIFDKLGMTSSSFPGPSQLTVPGPHPAGYSVGIDPAGAVVCEPMRDVTQLSPSMGWTASGVVSNVPDLKAYVQALASGSLLSEKSAKAQATGIPNGSDWQKYGLGVQILGPLRGSAGAMPGYMSAMYSDPSSGLTIVVALNNSTPGPAFAQYLAQRLASIVSKVPAKVKGAKVVAGLPWSEAQMTEAIGKTVPCPPAK